MVLALVTMSLFLSLFSHEIVLLLSNEGYLDACQYLILLCIPMSFYLLMPFATSGVSITRDTKYIGISQVAGSCGNLIFLFLSIQFIGILAVPLCLTISRIITYIILYKVSEKKIGYSLPNYFFIILIAVVLICYVIVKIEASFTFRIIAASIFLGVIAIGIKTKYNLTGLLNLVKQSKSHVSLSEKRTDCN